MLCRQFYIVYEVRSILGAIPYTTLIVEVTVV